MMQKDKKKLLTRTRVLSVILAVLLLLYTTRMLDIQVIHAQGYTKQGKNTYTRTTVIKAARGEILDRYGRQLAVNRNGYDIVFNRAYISMNNINALIMNVMTLMSRSEYAWNDDLPLEAQAPFGFTDDKTAVKALKSTIGVAGYATAEDCRKIMIERYSLQGLDEALQRKLMGVRYTMERADFSVANPYTFASDIPESLMLTVSESSFMIDGISIATVPVREYVIGNLASNVIGTVGSISAAMWEKLRDKGYSYSDKIGVTGIEAAYEDELHGTDGEITYTLDGDGNIVSSDITKQPVPGRTIILSLDKNLQQSSQDTMQEYISQLVSSGGSATGGAAVAIDIKSGEVLAAATYPNFDINDYFTKYNELSTAKNSPLTDRALTGIYPPGSSLKPVIGIAALSTGALALDEHITCTHTYKAYAASGFTPSCMGRHGSINIITALSKSCNYFFYEIGHRMGIDTINSYLKMFGFGEKTGVEVNESAGLLSDNTDEWFGGNTLQVAIGQHNAFTPIQICSATATIANSGTRYKTTFINKIVSYDLEKTYYSDEPVVRQNIHIRSDILDTIKAGMLSVTEDGTGSRVFKDYPIKIGGKTGTAQTDSGADHNIFVAFAPFDNPEIAVAVVIEHGASSATSGAVMKGIMNSYFFNQEEKYSDSPHNTALQ